jgi:hypothetical protein
MAQIPVLDPSPSKEAPFGYYSTEDTQLAEPIEDIDAFIRETKGQAFEELVDDDLDPYTHVALSYVKDKMIKFSGVFTSELAARTQATEISEGLFDTYIVPFQELFVLGSMTVDDALRAFAEQYNERIDRMKDRLKGISTDRGKATVDPAPVLPEKKPDDRDEEKEEELLSDEAKATLTKMRRAVKRGDKKALVNPSQAYVVISYASAGSSNYIFRVCSVHDSLSKAEGAAKTMYNSCKSRKRFDYLVASSFEWKPGPPIDFGLSVAKTHTDNQSLGRFYDSTNFLASDEYKQALENVSDFHKNAQKERMMVKEGMEEEKEFSILEQTSGA